MSTHHRGRHRGQGRALLAVLLLAVMAGGVRGDAPLTTANVVRFLQAGISEETILKELQGRGFAEPLDAAREATLREAGASETLVVAVRRAAPVELPASQPLPAPGPAGATPTRVERPPDRNAQAFASSTRTVRVPVSVLDKRGEPVMGLRLEDFRVSDEGKRQALTLFSHERRSLRLALALDVSGSMHSKMREVEEALRHFIELLEPEDEILVLTFSDRVQLVQDFTSDRRLLDHVLDRLDAGGSTALFDAAAEAIRRVAPGAAESKAVVLVTDGMDTISAESFGALRELAQRSEVPVFSIGLDAGTEIEDLLPVPGGMGPIGGGFPRPGVGGRGGFPGGGGGGRWGGPAGGGGGYVRRPAGFDPRPLLDLAEETGGRAEIVKGFARTQADERLKAAVESIAMTLRYRYLVGYEAPEGKRGWHNLRVEVDRPAANARARKGYYAGG